MLARRVRPGDSVRLYFDFVVSGATVSVTSPKVDIYDPLGSLLVTKDLSVGSGTYYCDITAGATYGTYYAVAYGTYNTEKLYAASQESFDVVESAPVSLVTLDDVRSYLNLSDRTDDDFLMALIPVCSQWILSYVNRPLTYSTTTEIAQLSSERVYVLRHFPVYSISSITLDDTTVSSSDYTLDSRTGRIRFEKAATGELEVTYTYGEGEIPGALRLACLKLVSAAYNLRAHEGQSTQRILSYVLSLKPFDQFVSEIVPLLAPFRKNIM